MDILCISGVAPGPVMVSVAHCGQVRQLAMDVARHQAGGWRARRPGAPWGLRCHSVQTAVLLEAAEAVEAPHAAEGMEAEACPAMPPAFADMRSPEPALDDAPWHDTMLTAAD